MSSGAFPGVQVLVTLGGEVAVERETIRTRGQDTQEKELMELGDRLKAGVQESKGCHS